MPEARLDALFCDVDDTLYSSTGFADLARDRAIEAMTKAGLRVEPERIRSMLSEIISEYSSNFPYQFDELLLRLPADTYRPVNQALIVASAVVAYHDTKFRELEPYEDVREVLAGLRRRGLRLGVITAGVPIKQAEKLLRLRLVDLIEPAWIFITEEMELSKQDPRLWRDVCKRAGLEPGRSAYVGDNPIRDVDPPNEVGMVTFLVRRGGTYAGIRGRTPPRHEIASFRELETIMREEYGV